MAKMNPTTFKEPVPYRAVNTCCLGYKTDTLMLKREIMTILSYNHTKSLRALGGQSLNFCFLNLLVRILTTTPYMVKHMYFYTLVFT
jgi:hypothetical protein